MRLDLFDTTVATNDVTLFALSTWPVPSRDRRLFAPPFHDQKFALVAPPPTKGQPPLRKASAIVAALACAGHGKPPSVRLADVRGSIRWLSLSAIVSISLWNTAAKRKSAAFLILPQRTKSAFANKIRATNSSSQSLKSTKPKLSALRSRSCRVDMFLCSALF